MTLSTFESLPIDVVFEIFGYLSSADIVQSFLLLNKRFSRMITCEYLWHIDIGHPTMSLSMFNDRCKNVLKLVSGRLVSLRVTLTNMIGGWSIVSSSLQSNPLIMLQRLHLVDIEPHELDKLLCNHLMKQVHSLSIDTQESNSFNYLPVQGVYLTKVCSQLPLLRICRLLFNFNEEFVKRVEKCPLGIEISVPNLSSTMYLRTLSIGIHTTKFLERLLLCIPSIENLSVGVEDLTDVWKNSELPSLPMSIDSRYLLHLSRLRIHCINEISFHRTTSLFSSVFGQLTHFSLKLKVFFAIVPQWIISGDTIQQLCIDRLNSWTKYHLNLLFYVENDFNEKLIYKSFFKVPFTHRQEPKVSIEEYHDSDHRRNKYSFLVYTLPYREKRISTYLFSKYAKSCFPMSVNAKDFFPCANELFLRGFKKRNCINELCDSGSSISRLIPWSSLKKISVDENNVISPRRLEFLLQMACNVHTLEIDDDSGMLLRSILRNTDHLGTRVNQQILSFHVLDHTLTLQNVQRFCALLSDRLPNLKRFSFNINHSFNQSTWKSSRNASGKDKCTKCIINAISYLVDHLQELVSLQITFLHSPFCPTPCFPRLIRRQLHQYPFSRPSRLRCNSDIIRIWL